MLAKTWRIYRIFTNVRAKKLSLKSGKLMLISLGFVSVEILICLLWSTIDPPIPTIRDTIIGKVHVCYSKSSDAFLYLLIAYNAVLLVFGSALAFGTRNVFSAFNESKFIGMSIYNIFMSSIIVCVILLPDTNSLETKFIMYGAVVSFACLSTVGLLFIPKILSVYNKWTDTKQKTGGVSLSVKSTTVSLSVKIELVGA